MRLIQTIYNRLTSHYGPQHWWPARSPFEVMVGAVLTQNTNWTNVEKAIDNLKSSKALGPKEMARLPVSELARIIKSSGTHNVKAVRLKNLVTYFLKRYKGDVKQMKKQDTAVLRSELLAVNGIGRETADAILLYALEKPVFVVDAYTKRMLYRHNIAEHAADYTDIQDLFHRSFSRNVKIFNEYHALIVQLGKDYCRVAARCENCPLRATAYSLKNKCAKCHRAFVKNEKTFAVGVDKARRPLKKVCRYCRETWGTH